MHDREMIRKSLSGLHAPDNMIEEIIMNENEYAPVKHPGMKKLIPLALAACLILALCIPAAAIGKVRTILGWRNNLEVSVMEDENGDISYVTVLHTEDLTAPVVIEQGSLFFIVNGEHTDITGKVTRGRAFLYNYVDDDGIEHYWIIGLNGDTVDSYGYAEYLKEGDEWIGGCSVRTSIEADGSAPDWLENAQEEIGLPW